MKTFRLLVVFGLLLVLAGAMFAAGTKITVLHVNDTHAHLDAFGPKDAELHGMLGGIARAASYVGFVRATESNVLLLHAGDVFQGDPMFNTYVAVPELQLMSQLGFDAMTIGNHEFDFGPEALTEILGASFTGDTLPLLSANLDMSAYTPLMPFIHSSVMKAVDGIKIGIFGLTTPYSPGTMAAPVIIREEIGPIAASMAQQLRTDGADVVIFLSHLGSYLDQMIASAVPGIDLIVGGHDHYVVDQPIAVPNPAGGVTYCLQAGSHYEYVGKLDLTIDDGTVTIDNYTLQHLDASVPEEPSFQAVIESLKEGVVAKFGNIYGTVVGTSSTDLDKQYDPSSPLRDTPLGNLVTDAFRHSASTQVAVTALGLISEKIYAGPIVEADVFRSMSYGYDLATGYGFNIARCRVLGSELVRGLEVGLAQLGINEDYFLQVSGMSFDYNAQKPAGHRVVQGSVRIGGRPLKVHDTYSLAVNTGIIMLLSQLGIEVHDIEVMPQFEYEVVRDYISSLEAVSYAPEGRIMEKGTRMAHETGVAAGPRTNDSPKLLGMYPNPFNPSTTIRFEIQQREHVRIIIFNTLGQEVDVMVNEDMMPGVYEKLWEPAGLPTGIYFCRMEAGSFSSVQRLLYLK